MVIISLAERVARLESAAGVRRKCNVILAGPDDDVAALVAKAVAAGRVAPGAQVIVVPPDMPMDAWEMVARAYRPPIPADAPQPQPKPAPATPTATQPATPRALPRTQKSRYGTVDMTFRRS